MPVPLSLLPKEMLRSPRWAVRVGEDTLRGLLLEQAVLLAAVSMAHNDVLFELGHEEGKGYWTALRIPKAKATQKAMALKGLLPPGILSFMEPSRDWVYLFLSSRPAQFPPFVVSEGFIHPGERVMGERVPLLPEEKMKLLEEAVANL